MKKYNIPIIVFLCSLFFGCEPQNKSNVSPTPVVSPSSAVSQTTNVKPIFNAAALVRKSPKEVEKILGRPTDSWTPTDRSDSGDLIQTYSLGKDMTVEFHKNRINSLVIFFDQDSVDAITAYRLVGLDFAKREPAGISQVKAGKNWIKVFY